MNHKMNLYARPFAMIASGEKLLCVVVMLYRYNSFSESYKEFPLLKCGYTSDDVATAKPEDMDLYYSPKRKKNKE